MTTAATRAHRPRRLVAATTVPTVRTVTAALVALVCATLAACSGTQSHTIVDYVDFVQVGDVQYLRAEPQVVVAAGDLGAPVGTVRRELSTADVGPDHHPTDGESGFLPAGTRLVAVHGYATDERIAAQTDDGWVAYDAYPPRRTPSPAA